MGKGSYPGLSVSPDLKKNLFSPVIATGKGLTLFMDGRKCDLKNGSKVVGTSIRGDDGFYRMMFKPRESEANLTTSMSVWHQRLAHTDVKVIKKMIEEGSVEGIGKFQGEDKGFCEPCVLAKQSRKPFYSTGKTRVDEPGKLIHMDLCEVLSTKSLNGSKYFLLAKDGYSNYRLVRFLKTKEETLEKIKDIIIQVKHETGNKVKSVRTDNGTEFVNKPVMDYFREKEIFMENSTAYCPQQNGFAERENRTVVEAAKGLLFNKNLPKKLWAEGVNTACYLLNRVSSKALGFVTPFERWTGKKPCVKHIRIFGTETYALIPSVHRKKLDEKSKKMILVGFDDSKKGYRLWNQETDKVSVHHDVIFNEEDGAGSGSTEGFLTSDDDDDDEGTKEIIKPVEDASSSRKDQSESDNEYEESLEDEPEKLKRTRTRGAKYKNLPKSSITKRFQRHKDVETSHVTSVCHLMMTEPSSFDEAVTGLEAKQWRRN